MKTHNSALENLLDNGIKITGEEDILVLKNKGMDSGLFKSITEI